MICCLKTTWFCPTVHCPLSVVAETVRILPSLRSPECNREIHDPLFFANIIPLLKISSKPLYSLSYHFSSSMYTILGLAGRDKLLCSSAIVSVFTYFFTIFVCFCRLFVFHLKLSYFLFLDLCFFLQISLRLSVFLSFYPSAFQSPPSLSLLFVFLTTVYLINHSQLRFI